MKAEDTLKKLHAIDRDRGELGHTVALLQWDEETNLPARGVEERAEQLALVEQIAHERFTAPETGRLLAELGSEPANPRGDPSLPPVERDFLRVLRRDYDREVKLPPEFVAKAARAEGLSQAAWARARAANDFAAFLPHLKTMIACSRERASYWGWPPERVYDGLLDIYEPGLTAETVTALFTPLRRRLQDLLARIAARPAPEAPFLDGAVFDTDAQARFNRRLMELLGVPRDRARLDTSPHPFTTSLGADDVRITTRFFPQTLLPAIFSTIHESGHALYELGFPRELRGGCLADGASMAIHESQSRLWENVIGRSRPFWDWLFPILKKFFPDVLGAVDAPAFCRAVNRVRPSLIRVDADEVTYSLHIILRFELEKGLFSGELAPEDLPGLWRRRMKDILGVEPASDAEGVLQDIHWSQGSFGYFPSYALGNLYGLQFWEAAQGELPGLDADIAAGDFSRLHRWLEERVYRWGRRLEPAELLLKVTGKALEAEPFLAYLESKY